jgi:hypothetical protein
MHEVDTAIRDTWRIFIDDSEDRITLIVEVLNMRGMWVPLHTHNSQRIQPDTIRIKENNISTSTINVILSSLLSIKIIHVSLMRCIPFMHSNGTLEPIAL